MPQPIQFRGTVRQWLLTSAVGAVVAGVLSGLPSTVWALVTGTDPWEATHAAGAVVVGDDAGWRTILVVATVVHGTMSGFWSAVLCALLPSRRTVLWGGVAGALIAVLDIALIGRALPAFRDLAFGPQLADHVAFGALVGIVRRISDALRRVGLRPVHFATLDDALSEAERLAKAETQLVGQWSLGQILMHLATAYEQSIDGMRYRPGRLLRLLIWLIRRPYKGYVLRYGLPRGIRPPRAIFQTLAPPDAATTEEGMRHFRTAVRRLQTESQRDFEGGMHVFDRAEWDQFHLRHAEMHLGFVYPIRGEVVNG